MAPSVGSKFSYADMYASFSGLIDELFVSYVAAKRESLSTDGNEIVGLIDRLDAVKYYLRQYSIEQFDIITQNFAKVELARAGSVYGLLAIILEAGYQENRILVFLIAGLVAVSSFASLPRRMKKVVRSQYAFLAAASAARDENFSNRSRQEVGSANEAMENNRPDGTHALRQAHVTP